MRFKGKEARKDFDEVKEKRGFHQILGQVLLWREEKGEGLVRIFYQVFDEMKVDNGLGVIFLGLGLEDK